ncbi:MAG: rRNA maturation RNase YbeY [Proteobacteria bacterium]|nr:rRNA maturation RNase YbeY [Pseudomonadota bacterium]
MSNDRATLPRSRGKEIKLFLRNEIGHRGVPARRSFQQWIDAIPRLPRGAQVNILIVGSTEGRRFNRQYRQKDYATNVLSFPWEPTPGDKSRLLGDLVICAPVVAREAAEQGKRPREHWAHLTIHGVLHLLGHDHEMPAQARRMEALEIRVLAGLGIANPYE